MIDKTKPASAEIENRLGVIAAALQQELDEILEYWLANMIDEISGGFYGKRLYDETLVNDAAKGVVLHARILWSFSAAARHNNQQRYLDVANRAYDYLVNHFIDEEYGGVYWSVDYIGKPLDTKKQVYALSFAIYGLSEYYRLTSNEKAKQLSVQLFNAIEQYSRDRVLGGYVEAFTRDWQPIEDLRLSDKDANEKKTMNTHLHVLEAYSNLYRIHSSPNVKEAIVHLLTVFHQHIIDQSNHHLVLFFDEKWTRKGLQISYGHDIEAAWLLCEAAEVIDDKDWIVVMNDYAIKIAEAAAEGVDADGGMWHEYDVATKHLQHEKHWWPQAEAMVGFLNAYQISSNEKFAAFTLSSWKFIKEHILDKKNGEWIWGVDAIYNPIKTEDKAGFWKCPYHNSRACLEVINRVTGLVMLSSTR